MSREGSEITFSPNFRQGPGDCVFREVDSISSIVEVAKERGVGSARFYKGTLSQKGTEGMKQQGGESKQDLKQVAL
ncbi:hypothetical protein MJO28_008752 [Puccinia striiformis f. sp. tritici]|uniref:Uncharacterized protein n=1 Tax=Puccinia striiformis f. sp. tritici TaxID=168172 RepID=A0ACC0ED30_9BASI|nr:hypothetical protein MJO28_008752 [Puccinia striiformis f. sp. tritici]